MTTDLRALIEDIEQNEPTRELNDRVLLACGLVDVGGGYWTEAGGGPWHKDPSPITNLEDAKLAVPEGWPRGHLSWPGYDNGKLTDGARADLFHAASSGGNPKVRAFAPTLARALVLAGLKAELAKREAEDG